jgi:hypothetical protein
MRFILRGCAAALIVTLGWTTSAFAQTSIKSYIGNGTATFVSEKGDDVGEGKRWTISANQGVWKASIIPDQFGVPIGFNVFFEAKEAFKTQVGTAWSWQFATANTARVSAGTFPNAVGIATATQPGMNVTGNGKGCNSGEGSYAISALVIACARVEKVILTFEQRCNGKTAKLRGTVTFDVTEPCADGSGDDGGGDDGGGDDGGGDDGGGDTGETPLDPSFFLSLPPEFTTEPVVVANATTTDIPFSSITDGSFASDVNLFATSDAQDFENFRVEVLNPTIPSPGIGDTSLRILTGPHTFPRTYLVTLTAVATDHVAIGTLLVNVTCDPPTILGINQPKNLSAANGSQVTLEVAPTGSGPFFYQWYKGFPGMTRSPVLAANESKLIFTTRETATYWVRITNACGSADSNGATVTTTGSLAGPARRRGGKS